MIAILWWTWTSQTLFDVRYAKHAKSEQFMKAVQLLIMIGYGVFEGNFSLFATTTAGKGINTMISPRRRAGPRTSTIAITVLFIVSRLQLAVQYFRVALTKRKSGTIRNSILTSAALPTIAALFWISSLLFIEETVGNIGIYAGRTGLCAAGLLLEMVGTFALRLHKRAGFAKTHLTERFGSLTIIILGEGTIKLVAVLRDISSGVGFEVRSAIAIAASIFSFYLTFALYFNGFSLHQGIDSLRGYSWAYSHYLFHLALVLALDGITSLLLFTNIFGGINALLSTHTEANIIQDLINCKNGTLFQTEPITLGKVTFTYNVKTNSMLLPQGTEISQGQYDYVFISLFEKLFQSYNVKPSEQFVELLGELDPEILDEHKLFEVMKLLLKQFISSAQFTIVAGGLIFLTMVPLMYWQRRLTTSNWSRFMPIAARLFFGLILIALALFTEFSSIGSKWLGKFLLSGMMIPGYAIAASIIFIVDSVTMRYLQFL